MGRKIRSARGEMVDFDLLKIKAEMSNAPKPLEVKARIDFVESRLRRKAVRTGVQKASEINVEPKPLTDSSEIESALVNQVVVEPYREHDDADSSDTSTTRTTMKRKVK